MNRRELLVGGIALAGAAMAGTAMAASAQAGHDHHHHMAAGNARLAETAGDCIAKGEACLAHCLDLLSQGDKEMAACAKSVNEMMAICRSLQSLAIQNSKQLARMAAIAADVCKQCEDECKKHADKHEPCKACGESCKACYDECKKISA